MCVGSVRTGIRQYNVHDVYVLVDNKFKNSNIEKFGSDRIFRITCLHKSNTTINLCSIYQQKNQILIVEAVRC